MSAPFSWSAAGPPQAPPARRLADRYLAALAVALFGYAVFGRAFAYLGVAPLYVGEALLVSGLALAGLALWDRRGSLAGPLVLALALLAWVGVRTAPYVGTYGLLAFRDAMVVGYALFAVVAVVLLTARPERLPAFLVRYRVLVTVVCSVAWLLFLIGQWAEDAVPRAPWAPDVNLIENKPGDLLVHLAGIAAFVVLRFRRPAAWLVVLLVAGAGATMTSGRGGMLAFLLAMAVFVAMKPAGASTSRFVYAGLLLLVVGVAVNTTAVAMNGGARSLSVDQLWENVKSLVGQSDQQMLDNTVEWRLEWWGTIVDYAAFGDYRWTGKGFGRNLADEDGFSVDDEGSLRSPHNVHMTILARTGLPGLALWVAFHLAWWAAVLRAWAHARRAGLYAWQGFFALCAVYWTAAMVNASFDVYLEGPMGAIWFWVVVGTALAGARLVRGHPALLDGLVEGPLNGPGRSAETPPAWGWAAPPASAPVSDPSGAAPTAPARPPRPAPSPVPSPWPSPVR